VLRLLLVLLWLRLHGVLDVVLVVRLVSEGRDRFLGQEGGEVDVLCELEGGEFSLVLVVLLLVEDVLVVETVAGGGSVVVVGLYGVQRLLHTRLEVGRGIGKTGVVDVVEVEGGRHQLLQVERIILVKTHRTEVRPDVEEGAGRIRNRNRQLQNAGSVTIQSVEVGRLGQILRVVLLPRVRLEGDLLQDLQWRKFGIIRNPLSR